MKVQPACKADAKQAVNQRALLETRRSRMHAHATTVSSAACMPHQSKGTVQMRSYVLNNKLETLTQPFTSAQSQTAASACTTGTLVQWFVKATTPGNVYMLMQFERRRLCRLQHLCQSNCADG